MKCSTLIGMPCPAIGGKWMARGAISPCMPQRKAAATRQSSCFPCLPSQALEAKTLCVSGLTVHAVHVVMQARWCGRPGGAAGQAVRQARWCGRPGGAADQAVRQARWCGRPGGAAGHVVWHYGRWQGCGRWWHNRRRRGRWQQYSRRMRGSKPDGVAGHAGQQGGKWRRGGRWWQGILGKMLN